jgi:hypothetical protein
VSGPGQDAAGGPPPSEDELRAAYEVELSRITAGEMILQAAVSLLNVGAYRLGPPAGAGEEQAGTGAGARDLEQARDAIDAAGALLKVLERRMPAKELAPLRDALSRLQMAYAREAPAAPSGGERPEQGGKPAAEPSPGADSGSQGQPGPGPAEASGRLWVPGR